MCVLCVFLPPVFISVHLSAAVFHPETRFFAAFSISHLLQTFGEKQLDKEGVRFPPEHRTLWFESKLLLGLLTPLNYSLRGKDKQSLLATVVLLISLGNITDNKKRAGGEELAAAVSFFHL